MSDAEKSWKDKTPKEKAMDVVYGVVGLAMVVGFVIAVKSCGKADNSAEVKKMVAEAIPRIAGYDKAPAYYERLFETSHDAAFDYSYKMGGRHTSATFDEKKYLAILFTLMIERAAKDGRADVSKAIDLHRALTGLPRVKFE